MRSENTPFDHSILYAGALVGCGEVLTLSYLDRYHFDASARARLT